MYCPGRLVKRLMGGLFPMAVGTVPRFARSSQIPQRRQVRCQKAPAQNAGALSHLAAVGASGVIGRLPHVVLDGPEPDLLAEFYSALLGQQPITYRSDDFWVVAEHDQASGLAFQRAPDHRPPTWPNPESLQQMHLDVMVDVLSAADDAVTQLGAQALEAPGVYADPAGHPFCLVKRPAWATPISSD